MKLLFFTLLAVMVVFATMDARPADVVEIENQSLVKFPDDDFRFEENSKIRTNNEAERIMREIDKINLAFGYRKKENEPERRRYPTLLDSSQYLFPQTSFFPFQSQSYETIRKSGGTFLQPSIRNLNSKQRSLIYFRPKMGAYQESPTHYIIPVEVFDLDDDDTVQMYSPNNLKINGYKITGDLESSNRKQRVETRNKSKSKFKLHPRLRLLFVPQQLITEDPLSVLESTEKISRPFEQEFKVRTEKLAPARLSTKVQPTSPSPDTVPSSAAPLLQTTSSVLLSSSTPAATNQTEVKKRTKPQKGKKNPSMLTAAQRHVLGNMATMSTAPQMHPLKNAFSSFFNRPVQHHNPLIATTMEKPSAIPVASSPVQQQQHLSPVAYNSDDYNWDDSSSTSEDEEHEKNIFGFKHKDKEQETQREALREGGIIIQRLRVRKGGIAIAGPGGVATAGSGGTAIVGPGGYALTHPRSLTIAGPGAKVIAIPETTDLKEALLQTSIGGKNLPSGGKIVATGPAIYYSPDTSNDSKSDQHRTIVEDQVISAEDGGLEGNLLQRKSNPDGTINVVINSTSGSDITKLQHSSTDSDYNKIQRAASQLVAIQEKAKQKGIFTKEDNRLYANSLYELGVAAQSLAHRQQNGQIKDFSQLLQTNKQNVVENNKQEQSNDDVPEQPLQPDVPNQEQQQQQETIINEENSYIPSDDPYEDVVDGIAINVPKKDAPVASAKPVALSIAGEGGSALAKPSAIALVGREGLAVSSPKATALAGISPEEAAKYTLSFPNSNKLVIKNNQNRNAEQNRSFASILHNRKIRNHPLTYALVYEENF